MKDVHKVYLKRELNMFQNRLDDTFEREGRTSGVGLHENKTGSQATVAMSQAQEQSTHQLFPSIKNQMGSPQDFTGTESANPFFINEIHQPLLQRSKNIHDKLMIGNLIYR